MKIYALHLPQFYETEYNNEWWGKGFTEWDNVKKGKPLYKGHQQPIIPLNNNYYDLSNVETIRWQAGLAKEYGLSGFVFFHYWYCGKHLLELPCELLLQNKDIDLEYSFCWANHSWTRAWDGKEQEILVKQEYGDKEEWIAHLNYLLPFFKDNRYTKIDNKPVLYIYKAADLKNAEERFACWEEILKAEGFDGIYLIEYINQFNSAPSIACSKAVFLEEPSYTSRYKVSILLKAKRLLCKNLGMTDYLDYDLLWELNLNDRSTFGDRKIVLGGIPRWDNSARRGKKSRVIKGATPQKFECYMKRLLCSQRKNLVGMIVLNAWNEWGEGAILEPTQQEGYAYLQAIKAAIGEGRVE